MHSLACGPQNGHLAVRVLHFAVSGAHWRDLGPRLVSEPQGGDQSTAFALFGALQDWSWRSGWTGGDHGDYGLVVCNLPEPLMPPCKRAYAD